MSPKKNSDPINSISSLFKYLNNHVYAINNSKLFAGLIIIILNISSKFVTIRLSKSMEAYLKYTFSRNILVFSIAWMGTRDIYVALVITALFIFLVDYLLNEDSVLCCLPESFTTYHTSLMEDNVSDDEVKKAEELLEKARKQKEEKEKQEKQQASNNVVSENFLSRTNYYSV